MRASPKNSPDAEERAFNRSYDGLFLMALAVLAFVALRGV